MAQAILAAYLVEHYPGLAAVIQYVDNVLVAGRCPNEVKSQITTTKLDVEQAGRVVSPKPKLEPCSTAKWMGKQVWGQDSGVENVPTMQAHLVCCWLRLATTGYSTKALSTCSESCSGPCDRARGRNRSCQEHIGGCIWDHIRPSARGLLEGVAHVLVPWVPDAPLPTISTMFCDATHSGGIYDAGQWGDELGMRIKQLPKWVATQQAVELEGVVDSVRLSAYRGDSYLKLYGDNLSSLVELLWVKGELNPSDVPSR